MCWSHSPGPAGAANNRTRSGAYVFDSEDAWKLWRETYNPGPGWRVLAVVLGDPRPYGCDGVADFEYAPESVSYVELQVRDGADR